mgnify:CR=1 FL=1
MLTVEKAVLQIMDGTSDLCVLSQKEMDLNDPETRGFLEKHMGRILADPAGHEGQFWNDSGFAATMQRYNIGEIPFTEFAGVVGSACYESFRQLDKAEGADLVLAQFNQDGRSLIALMLLVFAAGLAFLLYPSLWGAAVDQKISLNAQGFLNRDATEPTIPEVIVTIDSLTEQEETRDYPELWADMVRYNETIYTQGQAGLSCEYDYQKPSFTLTQYGLADEVFGVISIPAMELEMPIFLGATEQHMAAGAAHLSQTSLPIGGENTNCVIAGHRGYNGASYFRYIDKLNVGDLVSVTNLWETLTYRVCEIKIIDPHDVTEILIQPGRELLTLLTCHLWHSGR